MKQTLSPDANKEKKQRVISKNNEVPVECHERVKRVFVMAALF